jgi:hypothetical protein
VTVEEEAATEEGVGSGAEEVAAGGGSRLWGRWEARREEGIIWFGGRSTRFICRRAAGPFGLMGLVPAQWAASCRPISCRARPARWAEIATQHCPTVGSCRPEPEKIVLGSCSCRAKKSCWTRAHVGKKSCFGLAHGPRAIWPSIPPQIFDFSRRPPLSSCSARHGHHHHRSCPPRPPPPLRPQARRSHYHLRPTISPPPRPQLEAQPAGPPQARHQ